MANYSQEEKINYIFEELRSQKRARYLKFVLYLGVLGAMVYFYFNFINGMNKDEFAKESGKVIGEIIGPIVENAAKNMIQNINLNPPN